MLKQWAVMAVSLAAAGAFAADEAPAAQREAMERVGWMAGQWKGTSTVRTQSGESKNVSAEVVSRAAHGLGLLVRGMHFRMLPDGQPGESTHDTAGLLVYDTASGKYKFHTQLADGRAGTHDGQWKDGVFSWFLPIPGGHVRYDIRRNEKGQWHETGHFCREGTTACIPTFNMVLDRVGDAPRSAVE